MDALALLRLQIEWGADEALEDAPVDRLRPGGETGGREAGRFTLPARPSPAQRTNGGGSGHTHRPDDPSPQPWSSPRPAPAREGTVPAHPSPATASAPSSPALRAASAAGQAQTLEELRAALAAFDGCALRDTAANLVFAAGDPNAGLLLIGDAPGEAEDRSGVPFAGPDGALLDRMFASIGLTRDSLLLTPLIPWRPPGGRPPNAAEITVCLPFLHRLVVLAAPSRLLVAGTLAARTLLGPPRRRTAPAWTDIAVPGLPAPVPALTMPSPAMVARTPGARREAWAALRLLRRTLDTDLAKN
ncbi:MAG TPA: uracil-DNA glycosylase family protein [Acetobacteraceae bacterium]|nr:uracil-DNA glycosylase family protein [Acetobacteraceae bacterium]